MQQDAMRARGVRATKIDAPWVREHGRTTKSRGMYDQVFEVVLRLDGKGAHEAHADMWSKVQNHSHVDAPLFFAQLCMLLVEMCKSEGSVCPRLQYANNPQEWYNLCMLAAKVKMGSATNEEKARLKRMVVTTDTINLHFNKDVEIAKERLSILDLQKKKNSKKGKDKENTQHPPPRAAANPKPPPPDISWLRRNDIVLDEREALEEDDAFDADLFKAKANTAQHLLKRMLRWEPTPEEQAFDEDEEDLAEMLDLPAWCEWPENVKEVWPKMDMTLSALPKQGMGPQKEESIVAILLRFISYDSSINLGDFFKRLIDNHERRRTNQNNSKNNRFNPTSEMFPTYVPLFGSRHPAGTATSRLTYFKAALEYDATLRDVVGPGKQYENEADLLSQMHPYILDNLFCPSRILRWASAVSIMEDAEVDADYLDRNVWYDDGAKLLTYPKDLQTFAYSLEGIFWFSTEYVGICEQRFPYVDSDQDFLAQVMSGTDPRILLSGQRVEGNDDDDGYKSGMARMREMISTSHKVRRADLQNQQIVKYHTLNEYIYRYAEMLKIYEYLGRYFPKHYRKTWEEVQELKGGDDDDLDWEQFIDDPDLKRRVEECRFYDTLSERIRNALMKVHTSLWIVEGNVEELPVPDPIKIIQKWGCDANFPNMTRDYFMYDPQVGMFGNCILRMNEMFVSVSKIVHPILCILWIGLFSCYFMKRELKFNMMGHGWRATGKTMTVLDTPKKYICIPGTTESFTTSTAASDTTDNHRYDWIYLMDETEGYKVDPEEAKKFQTLVNKAKVKMVEQQVGHNVFVPIMNADGTTGRWSRVVTTDHFCVSVEVTNKEVSQKDALASRYYRFSMPMPKVPVHELGGAIPENMKSTTAKYMQIGQYLMCCAMKASAVGAILPEPDKELWSDMSARVINYLVEKDAITLDEANRGLDIMWPLVRQYVYMWAVHCAFDMPGAPNYKKKFHPSMIREIEPYMYMTMEIFWFGWTALASQWVDDNRSKFIRAVEKMTGFHEIRQQIPKEDYMHTNYCVYEHDRKGMVSWRVHNNPARSNDKDAKNRGDDKDVDLNYVTVKGEVNYIADRIAQISGLSPTDVLGLINEMKHIMITPPGGAYRKIPLGSSKTFHKLTNSVGRPRNKRVDVGDNSTMPEELCYRNPDRTQFRCEDDVPRDPESQAYPAVVVEKGYVHFMVNISEMYQSCVVIDALIHATMCSEFPDYKFILGLPTEDSTTMLQHKNFHRAVIEAQTAYLDEEDGWLWDEDTLSLQWIGDPNIPPHERPISRRDGVAINRRTAISESKRPFFEAAPMHPTDPGDDSWRAEIAASLDSISECQVIIRNFDNENALKCHLMCGRGFDKPVLTPTYIRKRFERESRRLGVQWTTNNQYPHDIKADELQRERIFQKKRKRQVHVGGKTAEQRAEEAKRIKALYDDEEIRSHKTRNKMDIYRSRDDVVMPPPPPPPRRRTREREEEEEREVPMAGAHSKRRRMVPEALLAVQD